MSSTVRTPPPTVSGMKHSSAVRRTTSYSVSRSSRTGGDVEKKQLVGAFAVVEPRLGHRVAGIDEIDKIDALNDPPVLDVETGNDPHLQQGGCSATNRNAARGSIRPS